MKCNFVLIVLGIISLPLLSQTQRGVVKKVSHQLNENNVISDVLISVDKQNAVKSDTLGEFEIYLHGYSEGDGFLLKDIKKTGFALKNPGDLGVHPYSSTVELPIYMYSIREKYEEQELIYKRWMGQLERNMGHIKDSLMSELENARIDNDYLKDQLYELDDYFSKSQNLFKNLSEYYALLNYDEMSEWEIQLTQYVEHGQFLLADSLINERGIENIYADAQNAKMNALSAARVHEEAQKEAERKTQQAIQAMLAKHTFAINSMDYIAAVEYMRKIVALDTLNTDKLFLLTEEYIELGQYDSAMVYANKIKERAKQLSSRTLEARGIIEEGTAILIGYKDIEKAGEIFFQILEDLYPQYSNEELNYEDSIVLSQTCSYIAIVATMAGEYALAKRYIEMAAFFCQNLDLAKAEYGSIESQAMVGLFMSYAANMISVGNYDAVITMLDSIFPADSQPSLADFCYAEAYALKAGGGEKAIFHAKRTLQLYRNSMFKDNYDIQLSCFTILSTAYMNNGDYRLAEQYMDSARIVYRTKPIHEKYSYTTMLNQIGTICYYQHKYEEAINHFKEGVSVLDSLGVYSEPRYSMFLYNIAQNYIEINEFDSATDYHYHALRIRLEKFSEDSIFTHALAESYSGLANLCAKQKKLLQSHEYYEKAFEFQSKVSSDYADMRFYQNMALYYLLESEKDTVICKTKKFKRYYKDYINSHIYTLYVKNGETSSQFPIMEIDGEVIGNRYIYQNTFWKRNKTALIYYRDHFEEVLISNFNQYSLIYMSVDKKFKSNILKAYDRYKRDQH